MSETADRVEYSLLKKDILTVLSEREAFIAHMNHNFYFIAERIQCETSCSKRRLGEAFDYWREDANRTLQEGIGKKTTTLDHFKHAAFIAFWLRRMIPINETFCPAKVDFDPINPNADYRIVFLRYGNEICALLIGALICLNYETARVYANGDNVLPMYGKRVGYLRQLQLPTNILVDFAMILKHKNMSPHALYLLYKSLFSTITLAPSV